MRDLPSVTAVVVAYNGGDALYECLESLLTQTLSDLEIIVVDNASTDGSVDSLDARLSLSGRVRTIRRQSNGGYAAGANAGLRASTTELVAILNQDLVLRPDCLEQMRDALLACTREALITPKLVLKSDPSRVNAIGNDVHLSGVAWCHGVGTPAADWHGVVEVTAISGAAFMARASFLRVLDGIEESYFMYMEDVDLSLRARLEGAACLAACDAVVAHDWEFSLSPQKFGALERNRRALWLRFWSGELRMLPVLIQAEAMGWAYAAFHGRTYLRAKRNVGLQPLRLSSSQPSRDSRRLLKLLARRHPYGLLLPGLPAVGRIGEMVDWLTTMAVR